MFILILCYIFSSTLNWGATIVDVIMWFNNHPFLAILCIEEIICSLISIKIIKK
ncbi:MAG: hypothetical protein IJ880_05410 [Bacilli bacterium]|nr:hypothetical protein [Bacilli bacterium]